MNLRQYWPLKPKPPKPVPDPGTTRRWPTVAVEKRYQPGSDLSIEKHGAPDPHAISEIGLNRELEVLDRRIENLIKHRLDHLPEGHNDIDNYVYQPQLNALLRLRMYKTRELSRAGEPPQTVKPMLSYLDDLYLRLYQTQDWVKHRSNDSLGISESIEFRIQQLMHDLIREIRDLSYNYQPATAVEILDQSSQVQDQRQQRLGLLLTDQWNTYIKQYNKK